ncbi:MAG: 2-oxoisovalerate dehydrogenase [Bacteroidota bacterium]|nr:2-oxoisovalerate dehydrogenase [Bacteroidota bacterium]
MNEIIFLVEEALEGGYTAKAIGESIFTEADTMDEIKVNIKEAIECYFDEEKKPKLIRLHMIKEEVIAV